MAFEVTCVTTDSGSVYDDCRCIETIGYQITSTIQNTKSPAEMHDEIKGGKEYYIKHNGSKTKLRAKKRNGTKYVRTQSNDTTSDNLLQQPSC